MVKHIYVLLLLLLSINNSRAAETGFVVFVSVPPQKFLVERIAGEHVDVNVMLTAGSVPEIYEPSPKQLMLLAQSRLYFQAGVPFEKVWMDTIRTTNKDMKIIECCAEITGRLVKEDHDREIDPHVWTSPANAKILAAKILSALSQHDAVNRQEYEQNYHQLIAELDELDNEIRARLKHKRTPYFIVAHASLGHFARDYGLIQLYLEINGKEIGPRGLAELIKIARKENIRSLFVQKQFRTTAVVALARELKADITLIDPLSENYLINLRQVSNLVARAIN